MALRIAFKNMDHSNNIEEFALKKLEKIEKLMEIERPPFNINMVIEGYPTHAHNKVELIVDFANIHLFAHHEGNDIYQEIDIVTKKMLEEIVKAKDKAQEKNLHEDKFKSA